MPCGNITQFPHPKFSRQEQYNPGVPFEHHWPGVSEYNLDSQHPQLQYATQSGLSIASLVHTSLPVYKKHAFGYHARLALSYNTTIYRQPGASRWSLQKNRFYTNTKSSYTTINFNDR